MTPQEQQDRCVLTRHDVQSIKDLVFILNDNAESSTQKAIFEILSNNMRSSHPHTPATPDIDIFRGDALQQHDATIRQQERERVLKELDLWRIKRMNGMLKKDVWIGWNDETDFIESLRNRTSTTEEQ